MLFIPLALPHPSVPAQYQLCHSGLKQKHSFLTNSEKNPCRGISYSHIHLFSWLHVVTVHSIKSVTNFSFPFFFLFFQVITENLSVSAYMHHLVLCITTFHPISPFSISQGHPALSWTWVLPPKLISSSDFICRLLLFERRSCIKL